MDYQFLDNGVLVEWDEEKNRINYKKHGISFQTASLVFGDENRVEIYDAAHSDDEDRYQTIGIVDSLLFVVYTERRGGVRLISARPANKVERRIYYDRYL